MSTAATGATRRVSAECLGSAPIQRIVTWKGKQYKITVTDERGSKCPVSGSDADLGRMLDVFEKAKKPISDSFKKMDKGDKVYLEFSDSHEFVALGTQIASQGETAPTVYDKIEDVFDANILGAGGENTDRVSGYLQNLGQTVLSSSEAAREEPDVDDADDSSGLIQNTDEGRRAFFDGIDASNWNKVTVAGGTYPDLFGALAQETARIGAPKSAKELRADVVAHLESLDPTTPDGCSKFDMDMVIAGINHARSTDTSAKVGTMGTLLAALDDTDGAIAGALTDGADITALTPETKQTLIDAYKEYITSKSAGGKEGNALDPLAISYFLNAANGTIFVLDDPILGENPTTPPSTERTLDPTKTVILQVKRDGDGKIEGLYIPKPELFAAKPSASPRTSGVGLERLGLIKDCGGKGNCGPLSMQDQAIRLEAKGLVFPFKKAKLEERAREARDFVSDHLTANKDDILLAYRADRDEAARAAHAGESPAASSAEALQFGQIETDMREALAKGAIKGATGLAATTALQNLDPAHVQRELVRKRTVLKDGALTAEVKKIVEQAQSDLFDAYVAYVATKGTYIDSAFLMAFANAMRESNPDENEHFNIAVVRPNTGRDDYVIQTIYPANTPISSEHTMFLVGDGTILRRGSQMSHYQSLNAASDDDTAVENGISRLQLDYDRRTAGKFLLSLRDSTGTPSENEMNYQEYLTLENTQPMVHQAISDVATEVDGTGFAAINDATTFAAFMQARDGAFAQRVLDKVTALYGLEDDGAEVDDIESSHPDLFETDDDDGRASLFDEPVRSTGGAKKKATTRTGGGLDRARHESRKAGTATGRGLFDDVDDDDLFTAASAKKKSAHTDGSSVSSGSDADDDIDELFSADLIGETAAAKHKKATGATVNPYADL